MPKSVDRTHQSQFRRPILEALVELGGSASTDQVQRRVFEKMKHQFRPADLEDITPGVRWWNTAMWERLVMKKDGVIGADSPRGTWEITHDGRAALAAMS